MSHRTVESALELVSADVAAIAMLEPGHSWVRVIASGIKGAIFEGYRLKPQDRKGLLEEAINEQQTLTSSDGASQDNSEIYRLANLTYGVAIPLKRQEEVVGVIGLFRQQSHGTPFQQADIRLLELFAGQVGPLLSANQKISELETALKSRDEFLSIASHDLRNPLTALRGFSQLTVRAINKYPEGELIPRETLLNNLNRVIKQSNALDVLIGKLLDVSRINTNRLQIQPEPLDLAELVRETVKRCIIAVTTTEMEEDKAPENRHILRLQINEEPIMGEFDRVRMDQVVTNLIDNAVKYSPDGGEVNISLQRRDPNTVELSVADQGIGIPEEKQAIIFNRWSRLHTSNDNEVGDIKGLGLGLFICREIVRKHGGRIDLESVPDKGSTFTVTLPLR
ncbi:MAG TPA: ATP-binding protein [Chloroflexia bacterium]|nr:ATP-binding protein [Chloroflexia bacterium]